MADSLSPGEIIKTAREAREWSQAELGQRVGISQVAIKKIESGQTQKSKFLPKVASVLGIGLSKLDPSLSENVNYPTNPRVTRGTKAPIVAIPGDELVSRNADLPVHASAQGGRGALVLSTDPVEWVARPQPLIGVKDGYGVIVTEGSMIPEFESGDIALVHPHRPPTPGKTHVFYAEYADGTVEVCIKRLRRETTDAWHVTQFNPPKGKKRDYTLKKSEWQTAHLTVGKYNGR